ncbi:hypothetical protein GXB81_05515 [Paraburkholderia sp. Ac-20336]|uniref:hypothetical protein n=1 Tax=Paraburkholderia sp. Ac-20336 TaxID=2703886 RepID=UPI001980DCB6|nr:hypothetical protein [Paraburkholderia sp. Ac-20336]MBN3802514.1 hypothetical protein [Paraburkholderia sp. Ac-20336]
MQSIPPDSVEQIAGQLTFLNVMLFVYLLCKGVGYASAVLARRDPPKKLIRSKPARSDES